ncbi:mitogen-activated protein kinase kinase kinase 20-like [Telopea speciosissima]|uniref:mitogen-activated protein kinase kinase kinase 20-like n=1 Tax=Telopea speciosissima TaxID=54955 RepID=UPI001CC49E2E|nr:mitogen-activated protein kinase kinase kinase 20-like [Telopea speciosissima]
MEWRRGKSVGRGSFCSVNLAIPTGDSNLVKLPQLMAVKSAFVSECSLLQREREILTHLRDCPQIIRCLGDDHTIENGQRFYNVFLEFASRGTLADLLKKSGGALIESEVRRYTKSILSGLRFIHEKGFVHCDIKLQNILVCSDSDGSDDVKIADFGLAKRVGAVENLNLRGTPLYMSPESITCNEHEAPGDVWSLGCAVAEMVMGRPAWNRRADTDISALLFRIGFGEELPEIPEEMSEQGKDFLRKCFVKDPSKRWTAEMLLNHPFVAEDIVSLPQGNKPSPSPRSAFDFPEWNSVSCSSSSSDYYPCDQEQSRRPVSNSSSSSSPVDRIQKLMTQRRPNWESSDSWISVR